MLRYESVFVGIMFATAIAFVAPALIVLLSGRKHLYGKLWATFCLAVGTAAIWIALTSAGVGGPRCAMLLTRLGFTAGTATTYCFLLFALALTARFDWLRRLAVVQGGSGLVLLGLFWGTRMMVKGVAPIQPGLLWPVPGPLFGLYAVYSAGNAIGAVVFLLRAYRHAVGRARLQLGYVLAAMVLIAVAAVGSLLPTIPGASVLASFPALLMLVPPNLITYAIIRHRLWDIRTVVHQTMLWLSLSLLALVPGSVLIYLAAPYVRPFGLGAGIGLTAVVTGLVLLHYRVVQPWLDHRFARQRHDPAQVIDAFNRELQDLRGVRELAKIIGDTVRTTLYVDGVRFFVGQPNEPALREVDTQGGADSPSPEVFPEQLVAFAVHTAGVLDFDALAQDGRLPRALDALVSARGAHLALPLVKEGTLLGVIELAEKRNLRAFTRDDLVLLDKMRAPATVALANAVLYDQLHELTASLENRVQQRTLELSQANAQLKTLDRQKSKFFANITHELRTPLTMIVAPLEDLLLLKAGDETLTSELSLMHRNALKLLRQINGLLDLAKQDAGQLRLRVTEIDVNELVGRAVRSFRPFARKNGLALSFVPGVGIDAVVGDSERLDLVFGNLLANAVKFTEPGGEVRVSVDGDDDFVTIKVRDTGIGIPHEHLERIFDRFAQVDSGTTRRYEGAGIGLSLVREIVALHRGRVEVASKLGEGSEFRVRLPRRLEDLAGHLVERRELDYPSEHARRASDRDPLDWTQFALGDDPVVSVDGRGPEGKEGPAPEAPEATVLVVEDNADMRSYLRRRLEQYFAVVACESGVEALAQVDAVQPDLILADVMMPELSGYDLCRELKSRPATAAIPVMLVTARKGVDRTLEGFRAGADDYLTKPFNFRELLARIRVQLKLVDLGRKLARQEKGVVLNLVAAGLAHEVRNPVNAILNAARPLKDGGFLDGVSAKSREACDELLMAIIESADRIDRLCGDFLGVSRHHVDELGDWNLGDALQSTRRLLEHRHGHPIKLEMSLQRQVPVFGRTAQLNQVLVNLLDNAVNACGKEVAIHVSTVVRGETFFLHLRDNGPGIPHGLEERIFDPLYTTGAHRGGSGLGLYVTRRIVEEHHGRITVRRHAAGGAEFVVELPVAQAGRSNGP